MSLTTSAYILYSISWLWGLLCVLELVAGLLSLSYLNAPTSLIGIWMLVSCGLQTSTIVLKACMPKQVRVNRVSITFMCGLIIAILPCSLVCSGAGTYLLQKYYHSKSSVVSLMFGCAVLTYMHSLTLILLIVRVIKKQCELRRYSDLSPALANPSINIDTPFTPEEVSKLPEFHATTSQDTCFLCLEPITFNMKIKACPKCLHLCHSHCIDTSLTYKPLCPMCRSNWRLADNS